MVQQDWKYLLDDKGKEHLFNIEEDPSEQNDISRSGPQRVTEMKRRYASWLKEVTESRHPS